MNTLTRKWPASRGIHVASFLVWIVCLSACATLKDQEPVQVYVVGVEPLEGQGLEMRMVVKLRVQNPNDDQIDFNGVSLSMDVEGKTFASGVSDASGSVPRFGETVIDVPITISALRALRTAMGMFGGTMPDKIQYELKGKLSGSAFKSVRFTSKGDFAMPKGGAVAGDEA